MIKLRDLVGRGKGFKKNCATSWVQYFKKRRAEGAQEMPGVIGLEHRDKSHDDFQCHELYNIYVEGNIPTVHDVFFESAQSTNSYLEKQNILIREYTSYTIQDITEYDACS
ncbi:hypothetical protein DID88_002687 [Monilinia fructigena]|uniref:Uncharacterized protein n=1 Tax=Monilinia fructigena TaxID=38457 RepID=A0A395IS37_9HELO|nr:hypothetical protein DID88_002687 [Monilinia fructigena]